jgi:hypothetical protein
MLCPKQFIIYELLKMKPLFLAFLFATILASATLILPHQEVSAQQPGPALVIEKVVDGSPNPAVREHILLR